MSERIYVMQMQENGTWEITGQAFHTEKAAQEKWREHTCESLLQLCEPHELAKLLDMNSDDTASFIKMDEAERFYAVMKKAKKLPEVLSAAAEHVEEGGLFTYEVVKLED